MRLLRLDDLMTSYTNACPEAGLLVVDPDLGGAQTLVNFDAQPRTLVNAARHRRTYRQEPGHKGALAVRLRKLAIDGEKTLQGPQNLRSRQSSPGHINDLPTNRQSGLTSGWGAGGMAAATFR
jgi:hypothetical protein